jgi:uncharacterized protein (DUF1499 family)
MQRPWRPQWIAAVALIAMTSSSLPLAWSLMVQQHSDRCCCYGRRQVLFLATILVPTRTAAVSTSSETIGKDPSCLTSSCLGVWDGLLADCPQQSGVRVGGAGCVASQDDTPGVFAEPWDYADDANYIAATTIDRIKGNTPLDENDWATELVRRMERAVMLVSARRGDTVRTVYQSGRYLRVVFTDAQSQEVSVGEFYVTPNDTTVQFRIASLSSAAVAMPAAIRSILSCRNKDRAELIRTELRFTKVPVLRNRQRSSVLLESDDWDTFGPSSSLRQWEMTSKPQD